jgi:ATP-binding cassette subfamily B protein
VEASYAELEKSLSAMAPAIVRIGSGTDARVLVLLGARSGWSFSILTSMGRSRSRSATLEVLSTSLRRVQVSTADVGAALTADLERELGPRVDLWLDAARIAPARRARARRELFRQFLAERTVSGLWLLRGEPGSSFASELSRQGIVRKAGAFLAASLAQVVATVAGWTVVGRGALEGASSNRWLWPWVLVSLTAIPLALASSRLGAQIGLDVAALLKKRLLAGALRMNPDQIRGQGSGRLLGTVTESTAIETAGLTGAIGSLLGLAQLASAGLVLAAGAGGSIHLAVLVLWCAFVFACAVRFHRRRTGWTSERLALSDGFVENVVANRTRIAQEAPEDWHRREDEMLSAYAESSARMDSASSLLSVFPARGWLIVGFGALVPAVLSGQIAPAALAISLGGIMQAQGALALLVNGATSLVGAHVAWQSIGRLFHAARQAPAPGAAVALSAMGPSGSDSASVDSERRDDVVLDARQLFFRYTDGESVLRGCDLTVRAGERVLLEGGSGSGKSTLASVLVGLRSAQSGHVLLRGLDRATLGDLGWRRRVASAPQFHDNHVLSGSLAFNLLMGRRWPPTSEDYREADAVCRDLGLGRLLDRMPSRLDQIVGETGWQLSHGERSRIFLARALLQRSELIVLDETFGALDPLTLRQCLDVVLARAPALVVIAHP